MDGTLSKNKIYEDIKYCIREAGLPVFIDPCLCDGNPNKFKSIMKIDDVDIHLQGSYDTAHHFAKVKFSCDDPINSKELDRAWQIINSMNSQLPLYHYSICPCCNGVVLQAGLHAQESGEFKQKFKNVISSLLNEIDIVYPLLIKTIRSGGNFITLTDELKNKYDGSITDINGHAEDGRKSRKMNILLKNIGQVIKKAGLIPNTEQIRNNKFIIDIDFVKNDNFKSRLGIFINDRGYIVISMSPPENIPTEKIDVVKDVINRLNNIFVAEHLWLDCKTNDIIAMKGITLPKMILDKDEFEDAIYHLISHGMLMIKTVLEQTISDQEPEKVVNRMIGMNRDQKHDSEERNNPTLIKEKEN